MTRVFISSVQKEFAAERKALCKYIREDVLLCKFFEPFLFEELPATNMSAQEAYLKEAAESEVYLGIYGNEYGYEDEQGVSPTEREYDTAVANGRHRIIFVKRSERRSPKEAAFIKKVEAQVVRKAFNDYEELKTNVYASLVRFLEDNGYLQSLPWDATYNREATLDDIDPKKIESFIALAREKRKSKLTFDPDNILGTLHQLNLASLGGRITNAALLLFGKNPQGFFRPSEVKCMLFPSPLKRKPILSYQVYEGGLFEMIDSAVGFVMQHIDAYVGTHTQASVDVIYEIPYEAVLETIVNACTHRVYTDNGSVQVELYPDRLEVSNPGALPYGFTIDQLTQLHNSKPSNPILAHPVYLAGYIERIGTGTTDIVEKCVEAGLPTPEYRQDGTGFKVVIWRKSKKTNEPQTTALGTGFLKNEPQNVPQNEPQNEPQKPSLNKVQIRYRRLLESIISNPHITREELSETLGVGLATIKRDLAALRNSYRIEWIGPSKSGRWEIHELK